MPAESCAFRITQYGCCRFDISGRNLREGGADNQGKCLRLAIGVHVGKVARRGRSMARKSKEHKANVTYLYKCWLEPSPSSPVAASLRSLGVF